MEAKKMYIRNFEARTMNAWPAIQTVQYDGWILRFAEGYTKRANSINPLYESTQSPVDKVKTCEYLYQSRKLPSIFKLTQETAPVGLDRLLETYGYKKIDETGVFILHLNKPYIVSNAGVRISNELDEKWLGAYSSLNSVSPENRDKLRKILSNIILPRWFVSIEHGGESIACGLGVMEEKYLGCFDIVVDKNYRQKGYGSKLMHTLISIGQQNYAPIIYLQVMRDNLPAIHLYEKLGFREKYRYWYRKKDGV